MNETNNGVGVLTGRCVHVVLDVVEERHEDPAYEEDVINLRLANDRSEIGFCSYEEKSNGVGHVFLLLEWYLKGSVVPHAGACRRRRPNPSRCGRLTLVNTPWSHLKSLGILAAAKICRS